MSSSNVNHVPFSSRIYERRSSFMEWMSKFFKSITGSHQPQFLGEETMASHVPDDRSRASREKEELDIAIAQSTSEDLKRLNGYRWRTENDDDLARSLNNSFNSAPYPSYVPRDYYSRGSRMCAGCKHDIGYGNHLECMGAFYHPKCFRCRACNNSITEHEFSLSGRETYHISCFKELIHPKCEVCHQFIPTNDMGLVEYRCHRFWSQKFCLSHEHDNTPQCCSCVRLESRNNKYISLGDDRFLCLECMESAIMDTEDCQTLYHSIRHCYEGMNMRIEQDIPMLLVPRQALNKAMEREKHGCHQMPKIRGLCLYKEQTVASIMRRPRMDRSGLVGIRTQPQKLIRRCDVTAILVLYGLPRLLTGAILAHELMHGWLFLKGCRNLRPEVEEGICQVMSHLWLESEVVMPDSRNTMSESASSYSTWSSTAPSSSLSKKGGKSSVEKKLGEFFMHQIIHDASPAYGGGFRAAATAVNRYGLRRTLDHIRLTGTFPE